MCKMCIIYLRLREVFAAALTSLRAQCCYRSHLTCGAVINPLTETQKIKHKGEKLWKETDNQENTEHYF